MESKLLQIRLNANLYSDFSDFDSFKDVVLRQALKIDSKIKKRYEKEFNKKNIDAEDVFPKIEEEYYRYENYEKEMRKALVLLLYSRIEIKLKRILNIHALSNAIDNRGIARFNFNKIEEAFKNYFDIDVKKIGFFNSFDELHVLNNCLKHEEIVSYELEKINSCRWHQGEEVKLTKGDLNRLVSESKKFFYNLLGELRIKLAENQ